MPRIDQESFPYCHAPSSLARHQTLERLADCTRGEYWDPDEILWALQALSQVVEQRLAQDMSRLRNRVAETQTHWTLEQIQRRLRSAITKIKERSSAHISELRLRVSELAELLAEYDHTVQQFR